MRQIEHRYRECNLRIKSTESIRLKTKRLVKSCKDFVSKRTNCRHSNAEKARQNKFRRDIHAMFQVAENSVQNTNVTNQQTATNPASVQSVELIFSDCVDPDENSTNDSISDPEYSPEDDLNHSPKKKLSISNEVLAQVSQTKGSYRLCQNILRLGVKISGANPNDYQLSKSILWEKITKLRSRQKNDLFSALCANDYKIIVHFDGKSYPRLKERHIGFEERIIVLCHTEKGDVPLGLFPVETHSGFHCGMAVTNAIEANNLKDQVVGLVSDTENVNTGRFTGACAQIERQLQKQLLHLMCRHHIFEVMLKDVFESIFGKSMGPRNTTFDVLNENWDSIKQNRFEYAPIPFKEPLSPIVAQFHEEASSIIMTHINDHHFRDNYAELNDLVLKFFGIRSRKSFRVPGATNNARWMSRAIYALKTYMFREHLNLDQCFINALERFCNFVALIYTKYWNQSPNAADAPFNDLKLLKDLDTYRQIDPEVADSALKAYQRHLWYLGDELVALSLFSEKVSNDEKDAMSLLLTQTGLDRTVNSLKYSNRIDDIQGLELNQFLSGRSIFLFNLLEVNTDLLSQNANTWHEFSSYRNTKKMIHDLITVVNDSAERALQLGANLISNQKVQTEERLQNFIVSTYSK